MPRSWVTVAADSRDAGSCAQRPEGQFWFVRADRDELGDDLLCVRVSCKQMRNFLVITGDSGGLEAIGRKLSCKPAQLVAMRHGQ
jgi:hypothetical protein